MLENLQTTQIKILEIKLVSIDGNRKGLSQKSYDAIVKQIAQLQGELKLTNELLDKYHEIAWKIIKDNGGIEENMGSLAKNLLDVLSNYRIVETRTPIKEPELYGNFSVENATSSLKHLMDNESVKTAIESATLLADLGSGIGTSTLGLSMVCPNAQEIHSVDASFSNLNEDIKEKIEAKSIHHRSNFHDFLEKSIADGKKFEVILIKSAPEHQLQKNNGYKLLAIATSDGGIVIELGDTELNEEEMMKYFSIEEDVGYKHYIIRVWKKN